jgi:hypothetical protein
MGILGKGSCRLGNPYLHRTTPVTQNYYNTLWIHSSPGFKPVIRSILKVLKTNQELKIYRWGLQVLMSQQGELNKEARLSTLLLQPDVHWWRISETNEDRPTCWTLHTRTVCVGCTELNRGQEIIYIYLKCSNPKEMSAFNVSNVDETLDRYYKVKDHLTLLSCGPKFEHLYPLYRCLGRMGGEGGVSQPACTLWKRNRSFAYSGNRIRIPLTTIL